jgi:biopolymer transport protein ExbD/biopolymer transport protein TolR
VPQDQIVVSLDAKSALAINTHPVAGKDYVAELQKALAGKSEGNRLVFFLADDKANYATLVSALDGAKQAGADTLGMMTDNSAANAPAAAAPPPAKKK